RSRLASVQSGACPWRCLVSSSASATKNPTTATTMTQASLPVPFSRFAAGLTAETAFDVLAVAKRLKAAGKDVIELQIGDSPFPSTRSALAAGAKAIADGQTRYCPSMGLPEFREAIARTVRKEFDVSAGPEN